MLTDGFETFNFLKAQRWFLINLSFDVGDFVGAGLDAGQFYFEMEPRVDSGPRNIIPTG